MKGIFTDEVHARNNWPRYGWGTQLELRFALGFKTSPEGLPHRFGLWAVCLSENCAKFLGYWLWLPCGFELVSRARLGKLDGIVGRLD